MTKKSFSKLNKGSAKLNDDLQSFLVNEVDEEQESKDSPILNIQQATSKDENSDIIEKDIQDKKEKAEQDKPDTKSEGDKSEKGRSRAIKSDAKSNKQSSSNKKAKAKVKTKYKPPENMPDDFRSRSILISESQLNELQEKILMIKLKVDKKYTMKQALYEAFSLWLAADEIGSNEYLNDPKTYSALCSSSQFDELYDRMLLHKAMNDRTYSLMRAVYEAIELYLKESKI